MGRTHAGTPVSSARVHVRLEARLHSVSTDLAGSMLMRRSSSIVNEEKVDEGGEEEKRRIGEEEGNGARRVFKEARVEGDYVERLKPARGDTVRDAVEGERTVQNLRAKRRSVRTSTGKRVAPTPQRSAAAFVVKNERQRSRPHAANRGKTAKRHRFFWKVR